MSGIVVALLLQPLQLEAYQLRSRQRLRHSTTEDKLHETEKAPFGSGQGRPLFLLNTIEVSNMTDRKQCSTLRFDKSTHAFTADAKEKDENSVAWGCYRDEVPSTGWGSLTLSTTDSDEIPLSVRAYGAGFLEGLLTYQRILQFTGNVRKLILKDVHDKEERRTAVDKVMRAVLVAWERYAGGDARTEPIQDMPRQAWAALLQLRGMRDGCNYMALKRGQNALSLHQLLEANMHFEIPGILDVYTGSRQIEDLALLQQNSTAGKHASKSKSGAGTAYPSAVPSEEWPVWGGHMPRGVGIVSRVGTKGDATDLVTGGVTVGSFSEMLRISKHYHLHFGNLVSGFSMSSYPGCISSTDDFMITSRGWVFVSSWLGVPPSGIHAEPALHLGGFPAFLRATVATRLASHPRTWSKIYGLLPGLAGGKQWLMIDYGKIKEQQPLANDTVFLLESLPRVMRLGDVTEHVRQDGFFTIYGEPFFRAIRNIYGHSNITTSCREKGQRNAIYDKAATIRDLASAREVLVEAVPSRDASVQYPIAPRFDQHEVAPIPHGAIDGKVTSKCLVQALAFQGRSSPGVSKSLPTFSWDMEKPGGGTFDEWPHSGIPAVLDKEWVDLKIGNVSSKVSGAASSCSPASHNMNAKS